jgi:hypothetical protein
MKSEFSFIREEVEARLHSFISELDGSGELHTTAPVALRKEPLIPTELEPWMVPRTCPDISEKR